MRFYFFLANFGIIKYAVIAETIITSQNVAIVRIFMANNAKFRTRTAAIAKARIFGRFIAFSQVAAAIGPILPLSTCAP